MQLNQHKIKMFVQENDFLFRNQAEGVKQTKFCIFTGSNSYFESCMIKLAIVIPVFNALQYTKKCLGYLAECISLSDKKKLKTVIIVTDDGSTDGTSEWIKTNYPETELCYGNGDLWWSGGINAGVKRALNDLDCDYILLWNNDIRPAKNYLNMLGHILETNPEDQIILSGIYIENAREKTIFSRGGNFNPVSGKHQLIGLGKKFSEFRDPGLEINWFPGMGTAIHRSVFTRVGYFDEKYFPQYKGDSDFALRAYKSGFRMKLFEELEIWNDRSNTGFSNDKSLKVFIKSLTSKKSNINIYRDLLFYKRHARSILAYKVLLRKYTMHIGGFIKWKILGFFGLKRPGKF